ncbi:hypothetical protein [Streptomyces murinus]|uniref:hypothetical protein n=1 Tax=Streptomyces murinus TaxID=33900 RepID=UPI0021146771|nr:hypothetical protein [Streptomyces murinus]
MNSSEDPAAWEPPPVRPRGRLAARFVASLLYAPLHVLLCLAILGVLVVWGAVMDVVTAFSERAEKAADRQGDLLTAPTAWPSWCVGLRELRHEGDAGYYRAHVDRAIVRRTAQVSRPRPTAPPNWRIPLRDFRGAGARYVAERAFAQGWQLRPSDVRKEVHLYWSTASPYKS